jgi:hypothetical protein
VVNKPLRSLLDLTAALLVLGPGCFAEPEPVVDDGGDTVVMCVQAPCTATDDPGDGPSSTTVSDPSTGPADGGTSSGTSTSADATSDSGTTEASPACGDGEVNQPSEMCDGTPGCRPDCTFESYECNPLNDAGCVPGLRCGAIDVRSESFGCMPIGGGDVGSPCSGVPTNDGQCDIGLTCLWNFNTPLCDSGNCCVEYCDLTDPSVRCTGGAVCRQFFINSMFQGLEHLGFCGSP